MFWNWVRKFADEDFWGDASKVDDYLVSSWVQKAYQVSPALILLVAGFPCKDTSRANVAGGKKRQKFNNEQLNIFWEILEISGLLRKASRDFRRDIIQELQMFLLKGNVVCDAEMTQG